MTKNEKLKRIQGTIDYALRTPEVLQALAKLDFPKEDVLAGMSLFDEVISLEDAQQKEYGDQYKATEELTQARRDARALYMRHLELARIGFRNHRAFYKTLQLGGNRQGDLFGWLAQARTFYNHIDGGKDVMKKLGVAEVELKQGKAMIEAVTEAYHVRQKEGSDALTATQQRDRAMTKLDAWMRRFSQTARLAFIEDPDTLKALGLKKKVMV
jgi:hypothetical protein